MPYLGNYTGAPSTQPQGGDTPFLRDSATPNAFGVNVDEANQQLGKAISGVGNEIGSIANQLQDDYNTAATLDGQNRFNMAVAQRTAEHNQLTGKAALDDQPAYQQFISDTREKILSGAPNGAVARQMNQRLSNISTALLVDSTRHVTAETYRYRQDQLQGDIQLKQDQAAQDPDNVDKLRANVAGIKQSTAKYFEGEPPEKIQFEQKKAVAIAMNSRFTSLAQQGRADQAMKEYDAVRNDIVDPGDRIHDSIYEAQKSQSADRFARQMVSGAGTVEGAVNAIYGQESGFGKNSKTSVDNAHGPMQIIPATFKMYAKEGETLDDPEANKAVGHRIIEDYYQKYNGDLARIATAYFSGEGNVSETGSTPWKNDYKDGNGKSVSSYVADVLARAQDKTTQLNSPLTESQAAEKARIFANQQFPNDPKVADQFEQATRTQYHKTRGDIEAIKRDATYNARDLIYAKNSVDPNATPSTWGELITDPKFVGYVDTLRQQPGGEAEVHKLQAEVYKNSLNVPPSDERDATHDKLEGIANTDPQRFRTLDLSSYDMTTQQRSELHTLQRKITAISQSPPDYQHVMQVLKRQDFFGIAQMTPSKIGQVNEDYDNFMGQLNRQVKAWTASGRKPTDDEISNTAAMLITKVPSGSTFIPDKPFYKEQIPTAARDKIIKDYQRDHRATPNEKTIRDMYNKKIFNLSLTNPQITGALE
jgi:hypothetical protein